MYLCITDIDMAIHPYHHPSSFIKNESFVVISNFLIKKKSN